MVHSSQAVLKNLSVGKFSLSSVVIDEIFKIFQDKGYTGTRYSKQCRKYPVTVAQHDLYYHCLNPCTVTGSTYPQT